MQLFHSGHPENHLLIQYLNSQCLPDPEFCCYRKNQYLQNQCFFLLYLGFLRRQIQKNLLLLNIRSFLDFPVLQKILLCCLQILFHIRDQLLVLILFFRKCYSGLENFFQTGQLYYHHQNQVLQNSLLLVKMQFRLS